MTYRDLIAQMETCAEDPWPVNGSAVSQGIALQRKILFNRVIDALQTAEGWCGARQRNDRMVCPCGLTWDMNDPLPPQCPRAGGTADSVENAIRASGQ